MQQRLAIAQALVKQPRVLLLDEPFGALDPGTRAHMHVLISRCGATAMTIFMVTHDIKEAFALGTRVIAFDQPRRDPQAPRRYGADHHLRSRSAGATAPVPVLGFTSLADNKPRNPSQGACTDDFTDHRITPFTPRRVLSAPRRVAPPSSRFRPDGDARLEGARGRRQAAGERAGARSSNGRSTWACPARTASTDKSIPTFARGELPHFAGINTFLKAPYVENVRDVSQIRRRRRRHPVRHRHHLPPRHALRAAGHPAHLGALHALQLRDWASTCASR